MGSSVIPPNGGRSCGAVGLGRGRRISGALGGTRTLALGGGRRERGGDRLHLVLLVRPAVGLRLDTKRHRLARRVCGGRRGECYAKGV
jgi:hypothetical protein